MYRTIRSALHLWVAYYFLSIRVLNRHWRPCSTRLNWRTGHDTLLLRLIPGDLYSTWPNKQFHTLAGLLDSRVAQPNSYPNNCVPSKEEVCTIFIMVFVMTWPGREPTTCRMRGGHAYLKINQFVFHYVSIVHTTSTWCKTSQRKCWQS